MRADLTRVVAATAAVLVLAACSSSPDAPSSTTSSTPSTSSSGSPSPTASTSPTSTTSPSPSATTLNFYAGTVPAVAPRGTVTKRTLRTPDGRTRSYRLFVPIGPLGTSPLLVALHGAFGTSKQFATNSGFDGLATTNRFLVAYADGVGRLADGTGGVQTWNGGDCCGPAATRAVDDVAFLRAVVADVEATHTVDPNRVYAAGHSNGGIMALRLACEASDVFVAVGLQSSALGRATCTPKNPLSLMQIHGTADTNEPIDGGRGSGPAGVAFRPARDAATTLAAADGCDTPPTTTVDSVNPDLTLTAWSGCASSTGVEFLAVTGAGHAWMGHPASSPLAERLVGKPYADLDSSRAIWSFLAAHPRR